MAPTWYDSLADALAGTDAPLEVALTLALVHVPYTDFEGKSQTGQLVVHHELCEEIKEIFAALHHARFPIQKMVPIVAYHWNDEASMADNNTSAFNYRRILATDRLSNHSSGRAIDINPVQNPYFAHDGKVHPEGAMYMPSAPGTISADSIAVKIFKEYRWNWLGDRKENIDYQHFQKT